MAGGIRVVYLLCLLLSVADANIIDDLIDAMPKGEKQESHKGGSGGKTNSAEVEWKWKSKTVARAPKSGPEVFDVTKYGAKNDGSSESTKVGFIFI